MRQFLIYLLCTVFLLFSAGNILAIEKKDKKSPAKENVAPTKKPTKKITVKKKVTDTARQSKQRKKVYDNFVDKNNNGINDRQEKLVEKTNRKEKQKKGDPGK